MPHIDGKAINFFIIALLIQFLLVVVVFITEFDSLETNTIIIGGISTAIGVAIIIFIAAYGLRWLEVSEEGVVSHFITHKKMHKWDDFCFVGVAEAKAYNGRRIKYIVCALKPIKSNMVGWYARHYRSILYCEYTPERLEEFSKICPREIEWQI